MIKEFIKTWKMFIEQEKRDREYKKLVKQPLNYDILQELINRATVGVQMDVLFADGTKIEIRKVYQNKTVQDKEYF